MTLRSQDNAEGCIGWLGTNHIMFLSPKYVWQLLISTFFDSANFSMTNDGHTKGSVIQGMAKSKSAFKIK